MIMLPRERQNLIVEMLRTAQAEIRVENLAEQLEVSNLTVRRDLTALSEQQVVIRTHGGAKYVSRAALDIDYHRRAATNLELKQAIAKAAVAHIKPNTTILINDGSTTSHLAAYLYDVGPLTVYTNSIAMLSHVARSSNVTVYLLGGEYIASSYSLRGSLTEQILSGLYFDQVFLGADGIDKAGSCLVSNPSESRLLQVTIERSRERFLLADHHKFGARGHVVFASLRDLTRWITTAGIPDDFLEHCKSLTTIEIAATE